MYSNLWSQKIVKDTLNGELVFVYPFRNELKTNQNYWISLEKNKKPYSYKDFKYLDTLSKAEFKAYKKRIKNYNLRYKKEAKRYKKKNKFLYTKGFKSTARKHPEAFIMANYDLNSDVKPILGNAPDGKYIQYFDTFYVIDLKGKYQPITKQISGIFYIKNNVLDGEAVWLNYNGDTLKHGIFKQGLKEGTWVNKEIYSKSRLTKKQADEFILTGKLKNDTLIEYISFVKGFQNGTYKKYRSSNYPVIEGYYTNNEKTGEWIEREPNYFFKGFEKIQDRDNQLITKRYTFNADTSKTKEVIIRQQVIYGSKYDTIFNFNYQYEPSISFKSLYQVARPKKIDYDLDEEKIESYDGGDEYYEEEGYYEGEGEGEDYEDEYMEEEMYFDEYGDEGISEFEYRTYDYKTETSTPLAKLIDSLGVYLKFDGRYEVYYPNGQLMVRYDYKNNHLIKEDTLFWDNGKPLDVITFDADSNHYIETAYDYNGKLYKQIIFDEKGFFKRMGYALDRSLYATIDGLNLKAPQGSKFYFYDHLDTMAHVLNDSLLIFRSYSVENKNKLYSRSYIPKERKVIQDNYTITNKNVFHEEMIFNESFENFNGISHYQLNDLDIKTVKVGALNPYVFKDTIPQRLANFYYSSYDITKDQTIYHDNKPFNGKFALEFNAKSYQNKVGASIYISLPYFDYDRTEKWRAIVKNGKRDKQTEALFDILDDTDLDGNFSNGIYEQLIGDYFHYFFEYPYWETEEDEHKSLKNSYPMPTKIEGTLIQGKPNGIWTIKTQFGKILFEIPFKDGQINGVVNYYDIAQPKNKNEYDYYNEHSPYEDSLPKKKVEYISFKESFKNGLKEGYSRAYNWLGEVTFEEFYKNGLKEGDAFEKNKIAITRSRYENGALDGYVQTFLTLPGKDTLKLFDLNFQGGLLNGESKSYHLNGKLAKHGFFALGDPIDDYEAYDTLGFKYHYVKFQYGFPIEEKIYEENQLSVKYNYDWRDSIIFRPDDITETQSLDRLISKLGLNPNAYSKPYYGRPSLIEKEGIDYSIIKYYANDTIARTGLVSKGKKVACWKYYNYYGTFLYEVDYFDTLVKLNDSIVFSVKGILTQYDPKGNKLSESYIIEKFEKYDCSHSDHYEIRQYYTIWEANDSLNRMNGYVKNYYDNGVLQNEGHMVNGLPSGVWKYYDPFGKLNLVGNYVQGKRDGRWLGGDLSQSKYLGDICLNPNLPNLEEEIKYREKLLNITITNYQLGKALNKEFYDINMNQFEDEEEEEENIEE